MLLFVGLGNPGEKYEKTRHNVGFRVIDALASKFDAVQYKSKFQGLITEVTIADEKVVLLKPMTYMNNSGRSVVEVTNFYKINPEQVFVFHDEIDIPVGKVKFKQAGGAAGHNGLKSIDASIGKNYFRIRIGVDHPGDRDLVSDYVLSNFSKHEGEKISFIINRIIDNSPFLIAGKSEDFLKNCNEA